MTRYIVSFIINNRQESKRAIDAESHEEAYEKFLKLDGVRNHPVKTHDAKSRAEKLWEDHYGLIKEQRKKIVQELIENSDKGVDYIQLTQSMRNLCEKEFKKLFSKELNDWTTEEKDFYLSYKDYRGRSSYLELKQKSGDTSDDISLKLDAITKLLMTIAGVQASSSEKGGSQLLQTISTGIVAGNIAKAHQLRELKELNESVDEIAEDVEDASGGFEM